METQDPTIQTMRSIFNQFKKPYMNEHSGGGGDTEENDSNNTDNIKQDVELGMMNVKNHIEELYNIVTGVIKNNGVVPPNYDDKKRAVCSVFEKKGVFPALRANPSLKDSLSYYATLDLRTYPYTVSSQHIDILNKKGVKPIPVILGNDEQNA
jgi:hypothetical protein